MWLKHHWLLTMWCVLLILECVVKRDTRPDREPLPLMQCFAHVPIVGFDSLWSWLWSTRLWMLTGFWPTFSSAKKRSSGPCATRNLFPSLLQKGIRQLTGVFNPWNSSHSPPWALPSNKGTICVFHHKTHVFWGSYHHTGLRLQHFFFHCRIPEIRHYTAAKRHGSWRSHGVTYASDLSVTVFRGSWSLDVTWRVDPSWPSPGYFTNWPSYRQVPW